jgi:hypothetical protein
LRLRVEGGSQIDFKLTRRILSGARVIAKGKRIRDVRRLVAQYGGRASKWVKKSGPRIEIDGEHFEPHWYEHPGMGRIEVKQVRVHRL